MGEVKLLTDERRRKHEQPPGRDSIQVQNLSGGKRLDHVHALQSDPLAGEVGAGECPCATDLDERAVVVLYGCFDRPHVTEVDEATTATYRGARGLM